MFLKKIRKADCPTNTWSGGTTTELYIWPEDTSYAQRNFQWRISTATVEVPESDFTSLPGYSRILMVLSGKLQLIHQTPDGVKEINLNAPEQSSFEGSWPTNAKGQVIDFNVMTTHDWKAELRLHTETDGILEMAVRDKCFLWILEGELLLDGVHYRSDEGVLIFGPEKVTGQIGDKCMVLIISIEKRQN